MKIFGTHKFMMLRRVMLGVVVTVVLRSFLPIDLDMFMKIFITQPVISHVPGFGTLLSEIGMDKGVGCGIVGFEGCGRLWMSEIMKNLTDDETGLGIVEKAAGLGFSS